jgi:hypothetical protein
MVFGQKFVKRIWNLRKLSSDIMKIVNNHQPNDNFFSADQPILSFVNKQKKTPGVGG